MKTPVEEIKNDLLVQKGIRLFIKRDDLVHPDISGNKFRKLKYNLERARAENHRTLSFARTFNIDKSFPGVEVKYVWGETKELAEIAMSKGNIPFNRDTHCR